MSDDFEVPIVDVQFPDEWLTHEWEFVELVQTYGNRDEPGRVYMVIGGLLEDGTNLWALAWRNEDGTTGQHCARADVDTDVVEQRVDEDASAASRQLFGVVILRAIERAIVDQTAAEGELGMGRN